MNKLGITILLLLLHSSVVITARKGKGNNRAHKDNQSLWDDDNSHDADVHHFDLIEDFFVEVPEDTPVLRETQAGLFVEDNIVGTSTRTLGRIDRLPVPSINHVTLAEAKAIVRKKKSKGRQGCDNKTVYDTITCCLEAHMKHGYYVYRECMLDANHVYIDSYTEPDSAQQQRLEEELMALEMKAEKRIAQLDTSPARFSTAIRRKHNKKDNSEREKSFRGFLQRNKLIEEIYNGGVTPTDANQIALDGKWPKEKELSKFWQFRDFMLRMREQNSAGVFFDEDSHLWMSCTLFQVDEEAYPYSYCARLDTLEWDKRRVDTIPVWGWEVGFHEAVTGVSLVRMQSKGSVRVTRARQSMNMPTESRNTYIYVDLFGGFSECQYYEGTPCNMICCDSYFARSNYCQIQHLTCVGSYTVW